MRAGLAIADRRRQQAILPSINNYGELRPTDGPRSGREEGCMILVGLPGLSAAEVLTMRWLEGARPPARGGQ